MSYYVQTWSPDGLLGSYKFPRTVARHPHRKACELLARVAQDEARDRGQILHCRIVNHQALTASGLDAWPRAQQDLSNASDYEAMLWDRLEQFWRQAPFRNIKQAADQYNQAKDALRDAIYEGLATEDYVDLREIADSARISIDQVRHLRNLVPADLPFDQLTADKPLVIALTAPQDGLGKTTTAANMAAWMASAAQLSAASSLDAGEDSLVSRVLLIDGDPIRPTLGLRVAKRLRPSISELYDELQDNPDLRYTAPKGENSLKDFILWADELPNLNVLAGPEDPEQVEQWDEDDYESILETLAPYYKVIIVVVGHNLKEKSNRFWLKKADFCFCLATAERTVMHHLKKYLNQITKPTSYGDTLVPKDKVQLVMMRSDADLGIDIDFALSDWLANWPSEQISRFPDFSLLTAQANQAGEFLALRHGHYSRAVGHLAWHAMSVSMKIAQIQSDQSK